MEPFEELHGGERTAAGCVRADHGANMDTAVVGFLPRLVNRVVEAGRNFGHFHAVLLLDEAAQPMGFGKAGGVRDKGEGPQGFLVHAGACRHEPRLIVLDVVGRKNGAVSLHDLLHELHGCEDRSDSDIASLQRGRFCRAAVEGAKDLPHAGNIGIKVVEFGKIFGLHGNGGVDPHVAHGGDFLNNGVRPPAATTARKDEQRSHRFQVGGRGGRVITFKSGPCALAALDQGGVFTGVLNQGRYLFLAVLALECGHALIAEFPARLVAEALRFGVEDVGVIDHGELKARFGSADAEIVFFAVTPRERLGVQVADLVEYFSADHEAKAVEKFHARIAAARRFAHQNGHLVRGHTFGQLVDRKFFIRPEQLGDVLPRGGVGEGADDAHRSIALHAGDHGGQPAGGDDGVAVENDGVGGVREVQSVIDRTAEAEAALVLDQLEACVRCAELAKPLRGLGVRAIIDHEGGAEQSVAIPRE